MNVSVVRKYQNCFVVGIVLFLVATMPTMMQYKIPTIMTAIMELFSIDIATATWAMSIFTFIGIVFGLPIGGLLTKLGPKKMIVIFIALDAAASLVGAFTPNMGALAVPVLMITRALEGLSLTGIIASCPVVIQLCVSPDKVGTASGIYMLGGNIGAVLGGVFTPILFFSVGFAGLWIGYALIAAVVLVIFLFVIKFPTPEELAASAPEQAEEHTNATVRDLINKNTILFFIGFAIFQVMLLSVLSFAPTALQQRGMDPTLSGFVSTLPALLAIISSTMMGSLCDKFGKCKPFFLICLIGMTITTPLMLNTTGVVMWVVLIVMGLTAMGLPAVAISAYPKVLGGPQFLTMGMGILMVVQNIGMFLGSFVPSMLLGPAVDGWVLCGIVLFVAGVIASACIAICKFK